MADKLTAEWATFIGFEKIGRLATVDEAGMPHNTPVYYVWMDGAIYFATQKVRKKARNLIANPKLSFVIDTPNWPHKGIIIQGRAIVIDNDAIHDRFREGLVYRYYGAPENPVWQAVNNMGESVLFKIEIEKYITWDYSTMKA